MPSFPGPQSRRSKRTQLKRRASMVVDLDRKPKRLPCLILDSSNEGFRLCGSFHLRRNQVVEVVLEEDPLHAIRCRVVWFGKAKSKQEGEAGLEVF